jgi:hypothetical protein
MKYEKSPPFSSCINKGHPFNIAKMMIPTVKEIIPTVKIII